MQLPESVPGVYKKKPLPRPRKPAVSLQPQTYRNILKGVNLVAAAIRPTLGPLPRLVVLEKTRREEPPEFLDDGATIARRIIEVKPRGIDIGVKLIRHALWKMHLDAGDGSTTMGVIYQRILSEGVRYVTEYGCNAMVLRTGLEKGLRAVLETLHQRITPLTSRESYTAMALGMCQGDQEMADMLGEIFDIVGSEGLIMVDGWEKWGLEREYIEGTYWKLSGWFSRLLVKEIAGKRTIFEDAALLITDFDIKDPSLLVPVLEKCLKAGIKKLVIVAADVSDAAIGLLVKNNEAKTIETLAVRNPKVMEMDRVAAMEDMAVLTGGKGYAAAAYKDFEEFQVEDLGYARRTWATESMFGIYGGKGDPRQIRKHIASVKGQLNFANLESEKENIRLRLGRLAGGTAIFRVGGIHETEREARVAVAERAVTGLRHAIRGGVVPGGGTALINAQSVLELLPASSEDEALAFRILARALEEPMRVIAHNAGYAPDVVIEKVKAAPLGHGFNARTGQIVDMHEAGILDSIIILDQALEIAVSGAAMALTTDVVIFHKEPKIHLEP